MVHYLGDLEVCGERVGGGWLSLPRPQHGQQHPSERGSQKQQKEGHYSGDAAVECILPSSHIHPSVISVATVDCRGEGRGSRGVKSRGGKKEREG